MTASASLATHIDDKGWSDRIGAVHLVRTVHTADDAN